MDILVVLEDNHGSIHKMSIEAIVAAQSLNGSISAIVIGENHKDLASEVSNFNLKEILIVNNSLVESYSADGYTEVLHHFINQKKPDLIICGHTYQTRDYIPRLSARNDIPFIPDVIEIKDNLYIKQVLNSKLNASCSSDSGTLIISVQSAAFNAEDIEEGTPLINPVEIQINSEKVRSTSETPFKEGVGDIDLESADILVSIGRGIEKKENVQIGFDLAKTLGAEVSASRPVVDAGWLESYRQVGSSGASVSPKLYLALGISGAIQHVVGMKGSKFILAINKDPDSPLFEISNYAIIGDVLEIVPKLNQALQDL